MKRKIAVLFMVSLLVLVFSMGFTVFHVQGTELVEEMEFNQPIERIGSYFYDVATGIETFIPIEDEAFTLDNKSVQPSISKNDSNYVPKGLSPDFPYGNSPKTLLGSWSEINPATGGQYRNTVFISVQTVNGNFRGTGFMIGPNTIATCGHVIHNDNYGPGNWPTGVTITPARGTSPQAPYGTATATAYEVGGNWANLRDADDDWGIIRLNTNIGDNVGWLGLRWQSNTYNGTCISLNGYPGLVGGITKHTMYRSDGSISSSYTRSLRSTDTNAAGGMSGGPVYIFSPTYGYQVIAFHRGSGSTYNRFMRIDDWIYNKFISFRTLRA